jgi:hypothetical protein
MIKIKPILQELAKLNIVKVTGSLQIVLILNLVILIS